MRLILSCCFLALAIMIISCDLRKALQRQQVLLNAKWEFKMQEKAEWMPAVVPGCIHSDLLQNHQIENPYFGCNEDSVQWIAKKVWEYRTIFNSDNLLRDFNHIELIFEGIDTYADIFLNGHKLHANTPTGSVSNMFCRWEFDVTSLLKKKDNELLVRFYPVLDYLDSIAMICPYEFPDKRALIRKAPYQFGWDWGPTLITCGLWRPVFLDAWNNIKIESLHIEQQELSNAEAKLETVVEIFSDEEKEMELQIFADNVFILKNNKIAIKKGVNHIKQTFTIFDPVRWNPNGTGIQKLYDISVRLKDRNDILNINEKIGLRTIELKREKDSIGTSFTLFINEKPVFMKGANYIPQHNFINEIAGRDYFKLLSLVKEANMNMLRVWGGGIYENDIFYNLCDSLGILIWQDFMFACALYPDDSSFYESIVREAAYQVKRLRNHPCMALWCGNNEVTNGWEDWGWKNNYSEQEQKKIWAGNQYIFETILPNTVETHAPRMVYHTSSPQWGWGHKECLTEGDSHYWGVWWGEEPFEVWNEKTGRFMSEYGFQSFPNYSTLSAFTNEKDQYLYSNVLKMHQKHPNGYRLINDYMQRDFIVPKNIFDYVYVSQLLQSQGIGKAIEVHRTRKPHCMGTLYWQLNDCYPAISWSSIDATYQPKALYYTVKKNFQPVIITEIKEKDEIGFYIVSDLQYDINGKITIKKEDFHGNAMWEKQFEINVLENSSNKIFSLAKSETATDTANSMITLHFKTENESHNACKIHFLTANKFLQLPDYNLDVSIHKIESQYEITLITNSLIKNLFLYTEPNIEGMFSDNYFDMRPFERKKILFTPKDANHNFDTLPSCLKTMSLKNIQQYF